ncbi:MAG: protein translocase subunit SecD [Pirellulaceae bacterium]|nr:protein translocase subunit SecD [Pirellulaceae bacterium]
MSHAFYSAAVLAAESSTQLRSVLNVALVLAALVVPFVLGWFIARAVRMADYWWRIGTILATISCSLLVLANTYNWETRSFTFPMGVDLKGGSILIYELEASEELAVSPEEMPPGQDPTLAPDREAVGRGDLMQAISNRINPSGTQEIVVRPYGDRQVEIIIPDVDPIEVERIMGLISTAGALEFRILANATDHARLIDLAEEQAQDPLRKKFKDIVRRADGREEKVARWVRVARDTASDTRPLPFKVNVLGHPIRNASTGDILDTRLYDGTVSFEEFVEQLGAAEIDVLVAANDGANVTGEDLGAVSSGHDESLRPCVNFTMRGDGARRFASLTSQNLPDGQLRRRLGIILDGNLLSAPEIRSRIADRGQITGTFTRAEVDDLVGILRAGRLPAALNKTPISQNQIGSTLGDDTIRRGRNAIAISLAAVLVFIVIYYRFAGIVACLALLMNLLLILAMMVLVKAPITLPGLAGLVLTVGMSVDANVLIFERIREELERGAALKRAIMDGFKKATTTIVDANLTTLITAIVLYAIGTDQIRGFAVTLILGILMSMFTAIFCSRVLFDMAERTRRMRSLTMMRIVGATHIDFLAKDKIAIGTSLVFIVIGIAAVVARGKDLFDIDFLGGTSVTMQLNEPMPVSQVRREMNEALGGQQFTLTRVDVEQSAPDTVFKVDSAIAEVAELQKLIRQRFTNASGGSRLASYAMQFKDVRTETVDVGGPPPDTSTPDTSPSTSTPGTSTPDTSTPGTTPAQPEPAKGSAEPATEKNSTDEKPESPAEPDSAEQPAANQSGSRQPAADQSLAGDLPLAGDADLVFTQVETPAEESAATPDSSTEPAAGQPPAEQPAGGSFQPGGETQPARERTLTSARLEFSHKINGPTLRKRIQDAGEAVNQPMTYIELAPVDADTEWNMESAQVYDQWNVKIEADQSQALEVLNRLQTNFSEQTVWLSYSTFGGQVAGDTRTLALTALLTSLLFIVGYIWFRFQKVIFGLAAVVALVHDVLVTLGAVAVSAYLAPYLGFLQIDEFKISLPIVAAFLTIVGYSLNDTIVVFDRIREVRGKSPQLTGEMVNNSINQTLSRTLLTSLTTLLVVVILYFLGGQGIHGFAFSLVVGVVVGTYSSIFIASPVLLWMTAGSGRGAAKSPGSSKVTAAGSP